MGWQWSLRRKGRRQKRLERRQGKRWEVNCENWMVLRNCTKEKQANTRKHRTKRQQFCIRSSWSLCSTCRGSPKQCPCFCSGGSGEVSLSGARPRTPKAKAAVCRQTEGWGALPSFATPLMSVQLSSCCCSVFMCLSPSPGRSPRPQPCPNSSSLYALLRRSRTQWICNEFS